MCCSTNNMNVFFQTAVSAALHHSDMDSTCSSLMNSNIFTDGLVRHDRLLTDCTMGFNFEGLPVVKSEHSYSMAGSDGDSIPDSPSSMNDTGMNFKSSHAFRLALCFIYKKNAKLNKIENSRGSEGPQGSHEVSRVLRSPQGSYGALKVPQRS